MAVPFKLLEWIVGSFTLNRIVDERGAYKNPLVEVTLSFGEKIKNQEGVIEKNGEGAELWHEYHSKRYQATFQDVVMFMNESAQAPQGSPYKIVLGAPSDGSGGIDALMMAAVYPFARWMVDLGRWVL
jgi:hypothetical protein